MNDIAKVSRNGRTQQISLPEGFRIEGDAVRVRREGRSLVLEPIGARADDEVRVPPGTYTSDTLPPLSDGAKAILASVEAAAPSKDAKSSKGAGGEELRLGDLPFAPLSVSDLPLRGFDPDQ